jgi:peroxiredoxin
MSRNTIYALIGMLGIAAGTLVWRQCSYKDAMEQQATLASILERTEDDPATRIRQLDSLKAANADDKTIQRIVIYQVLRAHAEMKSDSATVTAAVAEFLATDTSGAAYNYVSSVYADLGINTPTALRYAHRALAEVRELEPPRDMSEAQWTQQHKAMVGECHHILGRLYLAAGQTEAGLAALQAAADSVPDSPAIRLRIARIQEAAGRPDSALASYLDVIRLSHSDTAAVTGARRLIPVVQGADVSTDAVLDTLIVHARAARKGRLLGEGVSQPTPSFDLSTIAGKRYRLSDLRGKTVVLYFWATWCVPCKRQLPSVREAYHRLKNRSDIEIVTVSFDQRFEMVPPFLARRGYDFPVTPGGEDLYKEFEVQGLPTCTVIDSTGKIRFKRLGHSDAGDFLEELGWQLESVARKPVW